MISLINYKKVFKTLCTLSLLSIICTSCEDFLTIEPIDKTTGKDYWKKKEHVDEMVGGAYLHMINADVEEKAILWGIFRSDEVIQSESYTNNDMEYVRSVNLYPTQGFCNWASFYAVINRCNQVLKHAPDVLEIDPEFTKGDYEVARGQMLALRSLCYFYLVRAFRDVPYSGTAYESDEMEMEIPQETPATVLQNCINDLEEAANLVMKSGAYNDWRDKGYFTQDAVWTLLADIHLWRGSMNHNTDQGAAMDDYRKAAEYCEKVINSKDAWYQKYEYGNRLETSVVEDRYHLYSWTGSLRLENPLSAIFVDGNSRESILELQYDGNNNANGTLCQYLYKNGNNDKYSRLMASKIFSTASSDNGNTAAASAVFTTEDDYRFWNFVYDVNNTELTEQNIRKYGTLQGELAPMEETGDVLGAGRETDNFRQNWMVYRITDVMLMEAEALAQLGDSVSLDQAFELVKVVNDRSMKEKSDYLLKKDDYKTVEAMEELILSERQRELCFEFKRWFDLVRFGYRHMTGVDINTIIADQTAWPALYAPMVSLAARGYITGGETFTLKMKSEPFLYWPVYDDEMDVNRQLKQNPVFIQEETNIRQ